MDQKILVTLTEEEAYQWIKLCRTIAEVGSKDPLTPKSMLGICDRLATVLTMALRHSQAG